MKKYNVFKHKPFLAWIVSTAVYVVLVILIAVLAFNAYSSVINLVLGGQRPIFAEPEEGEKVAKYDANYFSSKAESMEYANKVVREISEEGFVLVKNDNALPLKTGAKVSVFGKNSVNLVYAGTGSAGADTSLAKTLFVSLAEAGFEYNPVLKEFYEDDDRSGSKRSDTGFDMNGGSASVNLSTAETPYDKYSSDVISSYSDYNDAAIVVYSRVGGEGNDLVDENARTGAGHYLQLDANEKKLLEEVGKKFENVVVLINSANAMELGFVEEQGSPVDACLLIGRPGLNGIMALGDILSGEVNPSGHTVDTYSANFKNDPSWANFINTFRYDKGYSIEKEVYLTRYSEGIYVGYRYFETRDYDERQKDPNATWYAENVVYPFGFGLSYTTFGWEIVSDGGLGGATVSADGSYTLKVKVTNTGNVAGKDVVQLYANAPYTEGGIAKAYKVLCGYAKTDTIEPGKSDEVEIQFNLYDIASYDYGDANGNGFVGYELEGGDYTLFFSTDAHNAKENVTPVAFRIADGGITYGTDPETGAAVVNRFGDADDYLGTLLSRDDWAGTYPAAGAMNENNVIVETMPDDVLTGLNTIKKKAANNQKVNDGEYETMPATGADNGIRFSDLIGLSYTDTQTKATIAGKEYTAAEAWEAFMDQLTYDEMLALYNEGAFVTAAVTRLGIPATIAGDSPNGWTCFMDTLHTNFFDNTVYCSETITASTWNNELAKKFGEAIGEEALVGNAKGTPYSGWYAPGANIHRSPFGGRNGEYFSEDSFLSGMMSASEIEGAQSRGVIPYMKHFAVNEQENKRQGLVTWIDEQTLREIYLKPFEMAVKRADAHGIMSSFNRIGTKWTGGDYRLLTEVLRNEWGFEGCVISDYNTNIFMSVEQEAYAGGDLSLQSNKVLDTLDQNDPHDVNVIRECARNVLYAVNNSNIMGVKVTGYKLPVWQVIAITAMSVLGAVDIGLGVWAFVAAVKKQKAVAVGK